MNGCAGVPDPAEAWEETMDAESGDTYFYNRYLFPFTYFYYL